MANRVRQLIAVCLSLMFECNWLKRSKSKAQLGSPCHWSEVFLRGNDIIRWFAIYNLKPVIYIHAFAPSKQEIWPFHDCFVLPDVWRKYYWHETISIWYILYWIKRFFSDILNILQLKRGNLKERWMWLFFISTLYIVKFWRCYLKNYLWNTIPSES